MTPLFILNPAMNKPLMITMLIALVSVSGYGHAFCFDKAGKRYNVSPLLLKAHAIKESHLKPNAINRSANGEAVGLMQIHSQWFPRLQREYGITRNMLLQDPCLNVHVGAWIIANNFASYGVSWDTVGGYYAGFKSSTVDKRQWYYAANGGVREIYRQLVAGLDPLEIERQRHARRKKR